MSLREYAIKRWSVIPPTLTNVSALPGKHKPQKLCLFSHAGCCVSKTKWLGEKYLHIVLNTTLLSTKNCWNRLMSVEDTASQNSVVFETQYTGWLKKTISGVHVSPGSAETLVRRGGIANHRLISYSLSNISAKNYQNQLMCVEVIVYNTSVVFLRHSVVN